MHSEVITIQFAVTALILMAVVWRKMDSSLHRFLLIMMVLAAFCAGSALYH